MKKNQLNLLKIFKKKKKNLTQNKNKEKKKIE